MEASVKVRKNYTVAIALVLIVLGALLRFLPHPPNFAPVAAIALFGGAVLPRRVAVVVPLVIMVASDLVLGLHSIFLVVWVCYALIALASSQWLRNKSIAGGTMLTIGSSVFFFVVTNFAVWLEGSLYPRTLAGLQQCFTLALPFFRNTLLSDLAYAASLFGLYAFAYKLVESKSSDSERLTS